LYGSRARGDYLPKSDYEVGVLVRSKNYISRSELREIVKSKHFRVYPFAYEDFRRLKADTPFQKSFYFRELALASKTLLGKPVSKIVEPPAIKVVDVVQDLRFNLGRAFEVMHTQRGGDSETAAEGFYKSCLYGLRDLEVVKLNKFPVGFGEIYKLSRRLRLGSWRNLVTRAFKIRANRGLFKEEDIFQNISFLNNFIEPQVLKVFNLRGNITLIR
jgi:hypothetical protein